MADIDSANSTEGLLFAGCGAVMNWQRLFWYVFLIGSIGVVWNCKDLPRDNPLDPRNPESYRQRVVVIEAFVNDGTGDSYCQFAELALQRLAQENEASEVVILEYHIAVSDFSDTLATLTNTLRYHDYVVINRGIPDVFINGTMRIQGAWSENSAYLRYKHSLEPELLKRGYFTIEAQRTISSGQIRISGKLARLGATSERNFCIQAVLCENINHRLIVRNMLSSAAVSEIAAGEVKDFVLESPVSQIPQWDETSATVVIFVQKTTAPKELLQASVIR